MNKFKQLLDYHFLFLFIGLVFGLQMVYVNPPWHTNDEDRHFYNAYALSNGQIGPLVQNGKIGLMMPEALANDVRSFQGIPFSDSVRVKKKVLADLKLHSLNKRNAIFVENLSSGTPPFGYIPAAIFIKMATILNLSPIDVGYWGRIGSLLAYLLIVFYAIKISPHFKALLFLAALSPMALYQGASVTYDTLNLALIFLLFAFTMKFYFQQETITIKHLFLFFGIAFLHRFVKDGYLFLYFAPLLLGVSKFKNIRLYISAMILLLLAGFLPGKIWEAYIQHLNLPQGTSFQKDFAFGLADNIKFHLTQPVAALQDIIKNIFDQGQLWIIGSIGRFGYSYTKLPTWFIFFVLLALVFAAGTENLNGANLKFKFQISLLALVVINMLTIVVMFYLVSPIGASMIFGLQGRYFTPFLPFLFAAAFYVRLMPNTIPYLKLIIPILAVIILLYTVGFLNETFYIVK